MLMERLRQLIVSVVGHVDHGKSSLLDKIRGSCIVDTEAGKITQAIGASLVPEKNILETCGGQLGTRMKIPGLLFIDTPGHAAFTSLRKRWGALADMAVLVVDVNDGFKPQTVEALEILKQEKLKLDFNEEIKKLPYIFKDPIKFDKKVDPKKLRFGSKIDNSHSERETYYTVKEIISPEELVLNNGLKIRLLGIKKKAEKNGEAIQFLREKTRGQKVFLRFDNTKYDEKNNLLCYLYLWNKTFINAHLIKYGFGEADPRANYKYKTKFFVLQENAIER